MYNIENLAGDAAVKAVVNPITDLAFKIGLGAEVGVDYSHESLLFVIIR